jgi:hypothetical protein
MYAHLINLFKVTESVSGLVTNNSKYAEHRKKSEVFSIFKGTVSLDTKVLFCSLVKYLWTRSGTAACFNNVQRDVFIVLLLFVSA